MSTFSWLDYDSCVLSVYSSKSLWTATSKRSHVYVGSQIYWQFYESILLITTRLFLPAALDYCAESSSEIG